MPPGQRKPWIPPLWFWPVFGLVQVGAGIYSVMGDNSVLVISNIGFLGLAVHGQIQVLRARRARGASEGR